MKLSICGTDRDEAVRHAQLQFIAGGRVAMPHCGRAVLVLAPDKYAALEAPGRW